MKPIDAPQKLRADARLDTVQRALTLSGGAQTGRETILLQGAHAAVGLLQDMDAARSAVSLELARKELMLRAFATWAGEVRTLLGAAAEALEEAHPEDEDWPRAMTRALIAKLRDVAGAMEVAETEKEGTN